MWGGISVCMRRCCSTRASVGCEAESACSRHAVPCRAHTKWDVPTSGLLARSRTQVHALGGLDVLELALALVVVVVVGGALGLSRAGGARVLPGTHGTVTFLSSWFSFSIGFFLSSPSSLFSKKNKFRFKTNHFAINTLKIVTDKKANTRFRESQHALSNEVDLVDLGVK